jgi:hypothetical protein
MYIVLFLVSRKKKEKLVIDLAKGEGDC